MAENNVANIGTRVAQELSEAHHPIKFPIGGSNVLLVSANSTYYDRQDVASCLLDTVVHVTEELTESERKDLAHPLFAIAYMTSLAKGLLDSMRFERGVEP